MGGLSPDNMEKIKRVLPLAESAIANTFLVGIQSYLAVYLFKHRESFASYLNWLETGDMRSLQLYLLILVFADYLLDEGSWAKIGLDKIHYTTIVYTTYTTLPYHLLSTVRFSVLLTAAMVYHLP
jgi:hypothetical protein